MFKHLKVGDIACREFASIREHWKVVAVDERFVTIGMGWTFDRETGVEYDELCPSISGCSRLILE